MRERRRQIRSTLKRKGATEGTQKKREEGLREKEGVYFKAGQLNSGEKMIGSKKIYAVIGTQTNTLDVINKQI